tara:strand:- start:805 stop:1197 length:393 start_codon:yes stop_codon:yes gene_type:complete
MSPTQVLRAVVAINWIAENLKNVNLPMSLAQLFVHVRQIGVSLPGLQLVLLPGSFFLYVFLYVGVSNVVVLRNLPKSWSSRLRRQQLHKLNIRGRERKNKKKTRRRKSKVFFNGVWCRRSFPVIPHFLIY